MWKKLCFLFILFHFHSSVDAFLDEKKSEISIRHFSETEKQSNGFSANDDECDKQLSLFDDAFLNREPWAIKRKKLKIKYPNITLIS